MSASISISGPSTSIPGIAIESAPQPEQRRLIPLRCLDLSPLNVRKSGGDQGIAELAALIRSQGVIHNLTVYEEQRVGRSAESTYLVVAGGRRWRALRWLLKHKHITADYEVPCLVTDYIRALELSLAENSGHVAMHPADQFDAFKALIDSGKSVADTAASFGVEPLTVQRRLKLANVAPEFLALYREGTLSLEHLMAFAVTEDHARQQQVWQGLKPYERHPAHIRRLLTENEVAARTPLGRFVGLKAYEKAGGAVRHDLFASDDGVFLLDAVLVRKIATEKLEKHAAALEAEGFAWVEVSPQLDYSERAAYGCVATVLREPTEEERAQLATLTARQEEIEAKIAAAGEDEAQLDALSTEAGEIEEAIEAIDEQRSVAHPEQEAVAGAIVTIGENGKVRIERGLLKPEDAKRFARERRTQASSGTSETPRTHSAVLLRRLTAHHTLGLQVMLAQRPDVALVALTHRLVLDAFFAGGGFRESLVHIDADVAQLRSHLPELESTKAHAALAARRDELRTQLPKDPEALFAWLLARSQEEVLALLACCIAPTLDAVRSDENSCAAADTLARAVGLDMRQWWSATAADYFASVPKARVLEVVREAISPEAAAALNSLKKASLIEAAEQRLAGSGWLPTVLRTADA